MKLKYQLALIFISISILVATSISILFFSEVRQTVIRQTVEHLEAVSETKRIRVNDMIKNKYELVEVLVDNDRLSNSLQNYLETGNESDLQTINRIIKFYKDKIRTINEVHLINNNGNLVASTDTNSILSKAPQINIKAYTQYKRSCIGEFFLDEKGNYNLIVCSPVFENNKKIGTMLAYQSASDIVSLTKEYTGLRESGETILVKQYPQTYLTPLRFNKNSLGKEVYQKDILTQTAIQTKKEILRDIKDYRGKDVIASARFIPEANWALITKIDMEEVMEPLNKLRNILITINLLVIGLALALSAWFGNLIGKPIEVLSESARKIKEGQYNQKVKTDGSLEIKDLSKSFNAMSNELSKKINQLNTSNESLNKFAYVISHDLKAPLKSLQALLELLRIEYKDKTLDKEAQEMMDMMTTKTSQMELLINQVLESAKKGDTKKLQKENIDLNQLLPEVISNLNPPQNIEISLSSELPVIYYNKVSITRVFQNLIGNAIKYNDKPKGIIKVEFEKIDNKGVFKVKDNGPGIKTSDYEKIFNRFGQEDVRKPGESSGIGLSIVKKIVTENKGEVWVEPNHGNGVVFCFTVPDFKTHL